MYSAAELEGSQATSTKEESKPPSALANMILTSVDVKMKTMPQMLTRMLTASTRCSTTRTPCASRKEDHRSSCRKSEPNGLDR